MPAGGIVAWYEKNLAKDFTADFAGGKVVFDRKQYIGLTKDILASVPDFTYTSPKHDFKKKGKNQVTWTAVVKGTHTGKPFSPITGCNKVDDLHSQLESPSPGGFEFSGELNVCRESPG